MVRIWKQEWVLPSNTPSNSTVKILKWVRTGKVINFDEEEEVGEETMALDVDMNASAMLEPVQTASAIDSLAVTPLPETHALPGEEATAAHHPDEPAPAPETNTPADAPPVPQINADLDVPSIEVDTDADTVLEASHPLFTQPSVAASSQDPLAGTQELLDSSQPFDP